MKELFLAVQALLLGLPGTAGKPLIRKCTIWNQQFSNEAREIAFKYPAVFIEITDLVYADMTYNTQAIDNMTVRLHIGVKETDIEDLAIFDLRETIFTTLQGFSPTPYFGRLNRVAESPDYAHDNVLIWTQDYKTTGKDYNAAFNNKQVDTTSIPLLNLTITTAH
jgi:hypothetical protein